jgi:hypothetical protein
MPPEDNPADEIEPTEQEWEAAADERDAAKSWEGWDDNGPVAARFIAYDGTGGDIWPVLTVKPAALKGYLRVHLDEDDVCTVIPHAAAEALAHWLLRQLGRDDGEDVRAERDALRRFKEYVHRRLDEAGVPHDPQPEINELTGCRIGCRLDWLLAKTEGAK